MSIDVQGSLICLKSASRCAELDVVIFQYWERSSMVTRVICFIDARITALLDTSLFQNIDSGFFVCLNGIQDNNGLVILLLC